MRTSITVIVAAILAGCSTGSQIVTGTKRTPTTPDSVKVYSSVPPGSEEIAIVTSEADGKRQGAVDKVVKRLKRQAAKLGANGIVLGSVDVHKGFIFYGPWFIPQDNTTIQAKALWVP